MCAGSRGETVHKSYGLVKKKERKKERPFKQAQKVYAELGLCFYQDTQLIKQLASLRSQDFQNMFGFKTSKKK